MNEQTVQITSGVQSQPTAFTHHIYFDGDIVDVINYREEVSILRDASPLDTVVVHIESGGGYLATANHIVSNMKACQAHIVTETNGLCGSAATLIFLAGDEYRLGEFVEFLFHTSSFGYSGKANNVAEYVAHTQKGIYKLLHESYKHFLTVEEIDKLLSGSDLWFYVDEVIARLKIRGEKLFKESGEFEPDPEVMKEWSKERLLSFMFDEEYDNESWEGMEADHTVEAPVCLDAAETTPDPKDVYGKITLLTHTCQGGDLSEEVPYVEFEGGFTVTANGWLMNDEGHCILDNGSWFAGGLAASVLKDISDSLGIEYKNNASRKVMAKLVLEFVQKVVDILNS